jgi:hypothetical protein
MRILVGPLPVGRHRVGLEEILIIAPTKRGEMLTSKDVWASRQLD